jgi:hypothetical protein
MKKKILSPLCSALVIPGLGQVINGNLKKGLIILTMGFLLFLGGVAKLIFIIRPYLNHPVYIFHATDRITETLHRKAFHSLIYFIVAFAMLWTYSVLEAFWTAKKQERKIQIEDNTI